VQNPVVTGLNARYFGDSGGATVRYYWIQPIYPQGIGLLSGPVSVTTPAALTLLNRVSVQWNPSPGAIGYNVYYNTSATVPTSGSILLDPAESATSFTDIGQSNSPLTGTVKYDGMYVWRARYSFATDGGAVGAITPADSDTIPANAVIWGGFLNPTTAILAAAGAATVSVGTTAGSSAASILAATSKASFTLDALLAVVPTLAVPIKLTASGQLNITVATNPLTAGVLEIFVFGAITTSP
jgi:hypothetical protein